MGSLGETSRLPHPRTVLPVVTAPPQSSSSSPESDSISSSPRDSRLPYDPLTSSSPMVIVEVESPSIERRRLSSGHRAGILDSRSETDSSCLRQQLQSQQRIEKMQLLSPIESPRDECANDTFERATSGLDARLLRSEQSFTVKLKLERIYVLVVLCTSFLSQ